MSRSIVGACPGCGAQISLRAADSVLSVCEYCSTTCVREGDGLSKVGVMAELFDDHSPLTLGAIGSLDGLSFSVIGRLQNRYSNGVWNEWRVLFDDGETAWLSEDNASYSFSYPRGTVAAPTFDAIELGHELTFDQTDFRVTYKESATVIAGSGELPFVVGSGYPAPVCDLRGPDGEIATLDYSDLTGPGSPGSSDSVAGEPLLYIGRAVELAELGMHGLSGERIKRVALQPFSCPKCGATVAPRFDDSQSLTCGSCASLLDVSQGIGEQIKVVAQSPPPEVLLPLGSEGSLEGTHWTVVGFMLRQGSEDGYTFDWEEYLLHNEQAGFRFLNRDSGHWSLGKIQQKSFATTIDKWGRGNVLHDNQKFDQFSEYTASVSYVMGEFFWRVAKGDNAQIVDFICPPRALSREQEGQEYVWTESEHLSPDQVAQAFDLPSGTLPEPQGIGLLQELPPSSNKQYWMMGAVAFVSLWLIQGLFILLGSNTELLATTTLPITGSPNIHQIVLPGTRAANLEVKIYSEVRNSAFGVSADLESTVPESSQMLTTEVGYYAGRDGDGSWTEGDKNSRLVFPGLSPGAYTITVSGEAFENATQDPSARYSIVHQGQPLRLPLKIGMGLILLLALWGRYFGPDPLRNRWEESQYGSPPGWRRQVASSDDDD